MTEPPRTPTQIAIAVVECNGRFLVGQRPAGVPLAGLSEFPGGKVEPGESAEAAAVRECQEETGLVVEVIGRYPDAVHDYDHDRVQLHFFACRLASSETTASPMPPFRWVDRQELAALIFPAANARVVRQLLKTSVNGEAVEAE